MTSPCRSSWAHVVTDDLVIIGAGGFGREAADVVEAVNAAAGAPVWRLLGVVDDSLTPANERRLAARGIRHLGSVDDLLVSGNERPAYLVGIGAPRIRRQIAERLDAAGFPPATVVHPTATIGSQVRIGAGSVICAGARLTTNIRLGRHSHLNPNVTVGHDSMLGDYVSMNPASSVSGDCTIESDVLIGVAAVVLNQLTVGEGSVVGASACVTRSVPPGSTVKGVPAK